MRTTASGSTTRRPSRSVRKPPPSEPPTYASALTKKKTPIPASVWPNAGSIERMSEGTSRPAQPTSSNAAQARTAARSVRRTGRSGMPQMLAGGRCHDGRPWEERRAPAAAGVYGRRMARRRPPQPGGVLFFVHGANETSEGLVENLARIEDQVRARGWDVTVVAPEWRRRSDLRLGTGRRRSTGVAGRRRCPSRSCARACAGTPS